MKPIKSLFFCAMLLLLAPFGAFAQLPEMVDGQKLPTLAPLLERVTPAVVNIATRGRVTVQQHPLLDDPFFRRFFQGPNGQLPRERPTQSLGSGVIVDAEQGYVVTNSHVIANAEKITVTTVDGIEMDAEVVGSDPETDLAVLKITRDDVKLTEIRFAEPDALRVGDFVIAIGNPFGLGQTATSGIVSALGRSGLGIEGYEDFIQTDASINPGNSGGALINLRGELVGINTAILSPAGGNIGIGFAIPAWMATAVLEQLIEHGEVQRGLLGVSIQALTPDLAEALDIASQEGVLIASVMPDSPAADVGLQPGDVIVAIDGVPVKRVAGVRNRIGLMRVGEAVELTILRNGKKLTVKPTIKAQDMQVAQAGDVTPRLQGAEFGMLETKERGQTVERVGVSRIQAGSPAHQAGLREGDIILSVNRQNVANLAQFRQLVRQSPGRLLLHIRRGSGAFFLLLRE